MPFLSKTFFFTSGWSQGVENLTWTTCSWETGFPSCWIRSWSENQEDRRHMPIKATVSTTLASSRYKRSCCLEIALNLKHFILCTLDQCQIFFLSMGFQKTRVLKNSGSKKLGFQKTRVPKNSGSKTLGFQQTRVPKNSGSKKLGFQKTRVPTNSGSKKLGFQQTRVPKNSGSKKLGFKKNSGSKL